MTFKSQKLALNATAEQKEWFSKQCGYARFAYNFALADYKETPRHWQELNTRFNAAKKEIEWAKQMDQRAALFGIKHLGSAISNWKNKITRFPKFKKRGHKQSYSTNPGSVKINGNKIKIPKIGWIHMFQDLRYTGKLIKVTISRQAHRWFVSITVETGTPNVPRDTRGLPVIGVDVGINTLATLDDGTIYENPKALIRYEKKIAREQKKLTKKSFLSKNWYKQKLKLERLHYRVSCIRTDAHQKATTDIVNKASIIGIETLSITEMAKDRKISKLIADAALGGFLSLIRTKCFELGIPVFAASQFFASSKTCSKCGYKKKDLKMHDRKYRCNSCGFSQNRDINAAINLKNLAAGQAESINACGA